MIRAASRSDADTIVAMEAACFGADAWSIALVEQELAADSRRVLLAYDATGAVGYGSIMVAGDTADVQRIAVSPGSRRHGHARALLAALLGAARDRGARRILLEVEATNVPAVGLYEAFDFLAIGRREHYYAAGTDAIVMERELSAS